MKREDLDALAQLLAPKVAALVLQRLATALGAVEAPYSTRKGHEPPEFIGRAKAWRKAAPTVPGAVKIGRWWSVPRSGYATWLAMQDATPAPASTVANDSPRKAWDPVRALASVGIRGSK